jgi:biopolymer transport protein ExbB/biopolymer transport protein TolQ
MTLLSDSFFSPLVTVATILLQSENTGGGLSWRKWYDEASAVGLAVMVVLLLMSIYSLAVMFERYLTFKSAANQSREFVPKVSEMLRAAHLNEALQLSRNYKKSHLAVVVNSGLQELTASNVRNPLRKAKRAIKRATAMKTAELQRGLSSLATVGSTAPFVGLFGTVIGIINAFTKMNEAQTAGIAVISGAIAEALIATAFGLVVAIPAVWMFNYFTNRVNSFAIEMHNSAEELIEFFWQQQPEP